MKWHLFGSFISPANVVFEYGKPLVPDRNLEFVVQLELADCITAERQLTETSS